MISPRAIRRGKSRLMVTFMGLAVALYFVLLAIHSLIAGVPVLSI